MNNAKFSRHQQAVIQNTIHSYRMDDWRVISNSFLPDGSQFVVMLHDNNPNRITIKFTTRAIETRVDGILKSVTPWRK